MRSYWIAGAALMLGQMSSVSNAQAPYGAASLLPTPPAYNSYAPSTANQYGTQYYVAPAAAQDAAPTPAVEVAPSQLNESPYAQSVDDSWNPGCDSYGSGYQSGWSDDTCYSDACGCGCCWYGGIGGLIMTRDNVNHKQLSFDDTNVAGDVINTRDAAMGWQYGIDILVGRHLGCGMAAEGVYWGLFKDTQEINVYASAIPGNLNTALDFSDLDPSTGGTSNIDTWYNAANRHRMRRSYEFHNLELNMAYSPFGASSGCGSSCGSYCGDGCSDGCSDGYSSGYGGGGCGCLDVTLLGGIRFFRFDETFEYATDDVDGIYYNNNAHEMFYDIDVENNLFGLQTGGRVNYHVTRCFSLYSSTKFGVFVNHISHHSRVGNGDGAAVVNNGPNNNVAFDIRSSEDDISFMGEIDLGMAYQISSGWSAKLGYRAVGISGIALTSNQIPHRFADIAGVRDIDSNGSLILHGAYASIQYLW